MPRSCEDFRFRRRQLNNNNKNILNLNKNMEENVTIDLDGGGPLKPFQVTCVTSNNIQKEKNLNIGESENNSDLDIIKETEITYLANDLPAEGLIVSGLTEPGAIRRILGINLYFFKKESTIYN